MPSDSRSLEELRIDRRARNSGGVPVFVWVAIVVLLAGAAGAWRWMRAPRAVEVKTTVVEEPKTAGPGGGAVLNASGYVVARRRATVSSKITGRVIDVLVEEGKPVRKNQVLARLDPTTYEKALALVEAELEATRRAVAENRVRLEQARLTLQRNKALRAEGIVNQADLDSADTEVRALEARLAVSEEQVRVSERQVAVRQNDVADTVILAPFDGVAISKDAQPGEMISPVSAGGGFTRTGICSIVDMSSLEIEVDVNESYIGRVEPDQRVQATLDAYPDWQMPAKVIAIIPTADRQKATVKVRIGFEKLDPKILPDMGVKVAFQGGTETPAQKPGLVIPKAALRQENGRDFVWLVQKRSATRRSVTVGARRNDEVTISDGLAVGDQVVLDGPAELQEGARVTGEKR